MFTEIIAALEQGEMPDTERLQRRVEMAMTKKLGVIRLPPSFWMQDPKINPRADHLLQAAMLLGDRGHCEMAVSVLAVEIEEQGNDRTLTGAVRKITAHLVAIVPPQEKDRIVALADNLLS